MGERINISAYNQNNILLSVFEIRNLLNQNDDQLYLIFDNGIIDNQYRILLQKELPKYHVYNLRCRSILSISPSRDTAIIVKRLKTIHLAAKSFRKEGIRLMQILGKTHGMNPFDKRELADLRKKTRKHKQRGQANMEWNYWFHGSECQFENQATGQVVELVTDYDSEFGALDSFFFLNYIKTTPEFYDLARFFADDVKSVTKALNLLEDTGKLQRIDESSQRGVVAL